MDQHVDPSFGPLLVRHVLDVPLVLRTVTVNMYNVHICRTVAVRHRTTVVVHVRTDHGLGDGARLAFAAARLAVRTVVDGGTTHVAVEAGTVAELPIAERLLLLDSFVDHGQFVVALSLVVVVLLVRPDDNYSIPPMRTDSLRLGVVLVDVDLQQYQRVDRHLDQAAHPELFRRLAQEKVQRLKYVTARPHYHHAQAETNIDKDLF